MKIEHKGDISHYINHFNQTVKLLQKADKNWFSEYQIKRIFIKSIAHVKDYEFYVESATSQNWTLASLQEELRTRNTLKRTDAGKMIPKHLYSNEGRYKNRRSRLDDNDYISDCQTDNDESSDESTVLQRRTQKKTRNKKNKYKIEIP